MMFQSLTPIQKIAIIWACPSSHFGVIPDGGLAVRPQFCALFGSKDPMAFLFGMPVFLDKPFPRDAQRDHFLGKEKRVSKAFLHGIKTVRKGVYSSVNVLT